MKKITKSVLGVTAAGALAFSFLSLSCHRVEVKGTADTAFAETAKNSAVSISRSDLSVLEALQSSFRAISSGVLPSVVEIDVTEKTT
ncbi:MAG: serine protease, partial [Treponema sp.]|nr:serine protease [Treponema sp.]